MEESKVQEALEASKQTREEAEKLLQEEQDPEATALASNIHMAVAQRRKAASAGLIPTANDSRSQPKEIGHLKSVVLGLSEKLQLTMLQQEELKLLQNQLRESNQAKIELQTSLDETIDQLRKEGIEVDNSMGTLNAQNKAALEKIERLKASESNKNQQIEFAKTENEVQRTTANENKANTGDFAKARAANDQSAQNLDTSEKQRVELQNKLKADSSSFNSSSESQNALIESLMREKRQMELDLAAQEKAFDDFKRESNSDMAATKKNNAETVDQLRKDLQKAHVETQAKNNEDIAQLKRDMLNKLTETRKAAEKELSELRATMEAELTKKRDEFDALRHAKEDELHNFRTALSATLASKNDDLQNTQKATADAETELNDKLNTEKNAHEEKQNEVINAQRQAKATEIDELKKANLALQKEIAITNGKLALEAEQTEMVLAITQRHSEHERQSSCLADLHKETAAEFAKHTDEHGASLTQAARHKDSIQQRNAQALDEHDQVKAQVAEVKAKNKEIKENINTLSSLCENSEQLHDTLSTADEEYKEHLVQNDDLVHNLSTSSEYIMEQSKKVLKSSTHHEQLSSAVEDKHFEVEALREIEAELKKRRPTYQPINDDPVDQALATYVNARNDVLAVPFNREDFEIYTFGTKRVFVKIEKGKVIVRVGGGFMQIDEFIEIYTPIELEKQEARLIETNPAYRKIIGKLLGQHMDPKTPMSPQKAAKILHGTVESKYSSAYAVRRQSPTRPQSPEKRSPSRRSPVRRPTK